MSEAVTFRCDECGKLKEESDHWYRAAVVPSVARFEIASWEHGLVGFADPATQTLHLCSTHCAVKAMAKAMEGK